jgi:hypothetical protein
MLKQKREKISQINLGKLDRFRAAGKMFSIIKRSGLQTECVNLHKQGYLRLTTRPNTIFVVTMKKALLTSLNRIYY